MPSLIGTAEEYELYRRGESRSLTTLCPDIRREHHPPTPHACELPSRQRFRRLLRPSLRWPRKRSLPREGRRGFMGVLAAPERTLKHTGQKPGWRTCGVTERFLRSDLLEAGFGLTSVDRPIGNTPIRRDERVYGSIWRHCLEIVQFGGVLIEQIRTLPAVRL
jgi:hypothetical protein